MAIVALYGSPRRRGNTARLLEAAVTGARETGAEVREFVLRDLKISPCLEIYACERGGEGGCAIKDDFQQVAEALLGAGATMLASPIFFYAVSAQVKALMDRCQSLWVKKYWIDAKPLGRLDNPKPGLFLSVGATRGKNLFTGAELSVKYFFDTFNTRLWRTLAYRGLDRADEILQHPEYLEEARRAGMELAGKVVS
ncbi:MAG: flavodoxin family protein [Deltaproteobacteria bacterium]|nr:flavodoxin family protein [Deltaproteobacteria bacterium]